MIARAKFTAALLLVNESQVFPGLWGDVEITLQRWPARPNGGKPVASVVWTARPDKKKFATKSSGDAPKKRGEERQGMSRYRSRSLWQSTNRAQRTVARATDVTIFEQ